MPHLNKKTPLKIVFVGSEGAGKTFATNFFAKLYQTFSAIEFGSWYCKNRLPSYLNKNGAFNTTKADYLKIIQGQNEIWTKIIKKSISSQKNLCFFDSDLIFTKYFINKQFSNWNMIDNLILKQPIDVFIFLKSRNIFFKKDAIINSQNALCEIEILLKMYQSYVPSKKLIVIDNDDNQTLLTKIQKKIMELLPDVAHPSIDS